MTTAHRYRLHRAGIVNVWQYGNQVFQFEDGRLLLRGKNGAGKSKALEMMLPFLLDGDVKRLDATGAGKTTFRWLMSEGATGVNRQGFVWLELRRTGDRGEAEFVTVGAVVRWSSSTAEARLAYFVTALRVGAGLDLVVDGQPVPLDRLREVLGEGCLLTSAREYRARVGRELFGISDAGRYRNLVHLLYRLRRPTIGDRIEAGQLTSELSEALPPVDDDVLDSVAHNLDDLETVRADLGRLEGTHVALDDLMTAYRGYLRGELRRRVSTVELALAELRSRRKQTGQAELALTNAVATEEAAAQEAERWATAERQARAELGALRESAAYQAVRDLAQRRAAVRALASAARSAERAAAADRQALHDVAAAVKAETERLATEISQLHENHRDLVANAVAAGVDQGHLGSPPELSYRGAAADPSLPVIRTASAVHDLEAHLSQVKVAEDAVRARRTAVSELRRLIEVADKADGQAARSQADSELLDGQQGTAADRLEELTGTLVAASAAFATAVREWGLSPALTGADLRRVHEAILTEDPLPAVTPAAVGAAAEAAAEPLRRENSARRDELRTRRDRAADALDRVRADHRHWTGLTDALPPRSRFRVDDAIPPGAKPLYRLVDFAAHLDDRQRSGLEAALESSGLLDGLVADDGTVRHPVSGEVVLDPGPQAADLNLSQALVPVAGAEQVVAVLRAIGLGPASGSSSWIADDGGWRLGVAHGTWHKPAAEYVGAANREALRRRRLAELQAQIDECSAGLRLLDEELAANERERDSLTEALRALPDGTALREAWPRRDEGESALNRITRQVAAAQRRTRELRGIADGHRRNADAAADAYLLPTDHGELQAVEHRLRRLGDDLPRHAREVTGIIRRFEPYEARLARHVEAREHAVGTAAEAESAAEEHLAAEQALAILEQSLGADEGEILRQETAAEHRLQAAGTALPQARSAYQNARDHRVNATGERDRAQQLRSQQEQATLEAGTALPRVLTLPGIAPALNLDEPLLHRAATGTPPQRIQQLGEVAGRLRDALGPARADLGENALHNRYDDVRNRLPGGYDLSWEDRDGVKVIEIADDIGQHPVAVAVTRLGAELEQKRSAVAEREQQAFERFLLGELGEALSRQIISARALVETMNTTLAGVRTSHGLGARLVWELRDDSDADTRAAVQLLRTPLHLRTRENNSRLRDALSRRVEDARRADPSAGYSVHLRAALDYRQWFRFSVKVTDQANPDNVRTLSARTAMSQGEQRVVSYLVLFAAAAAYFTSVGAGHPRAPRLILLDDAFAKVDEPTHGRLLRLLVDLDLDVVLTSERLWGCFPQVPSLGIYECLRDPAQPGVATLHFRWDGSRRSVLTT